MSSNKKAVVIGSGFGGLAAGIRLQAMGVDTIILEKNKRVGGHAYQIKKKGYTFDMGPSIITAPQLLRDLFEKAGEKMQDHLELIALTPFYRIYYHDKTYIDYSNDIRSLKRQIAKFNKKDAENLKPFLQYSKSLYHTVITQKLGARTFDNHWDVVKILPKMIKKRAYLSVKKTVDQFFSDFRTRFLFSFHPLFLGGNPFRTPSVFLMIPYLEIKDGVYFTKGGMYFLVMALEKVFKKLGGKIITKTEVEKIIVKEKKAKGVIAKGRKINADIIISNAHSAHTYKDLISPRQRHKWTDEKIRNTKYSMSCFLLYLGVEKKYKKIKHHTIILSKRYKGLIQDIFDKKILPNDFSIYLHAPTKTDDSMAPKNCESIYLLVPTANLKSEINWQVEKHRLADKIIDFLEKDFGLSNLRKNIKVLEVFTPEDFKIKRNNYLGASWSVEPRLTQIASFRPKNKSEDIKNLYLVGASTHPGAGIPGVLLSAEATVNSIKEDYNL